MQDNYYSCFTDEEMDGIPELPSTGWSRWEDVAANLEKLEDSGLPPIMTKSGLCSPAPSYPGPQMAGQNGWGLYEFLLSHV